MTVWCALSLHGVMEPYFFENEQGVSFTVTANRYVEMLQSFVRPELNIFPHVQEAWA